MADLHIWSLVAVIALVTAALRFLPFLVFSDAGKTPKLIENLGRVLPFAIMGMLVVYCLKEIDFSSAANYMPQLIACAIVTGLHVWKRNTLISIVGGTVCYMLLVQLVF